MRVEQVIVRELRMPLRSGFATSFARVTAREMLVVEVRAEGLTGWGEAPVASRPHYSPETTVTARHALREFLAPAVVGRDLASVEAYVAATAWVRGHKMARAGLESALRDLLAKRDGISLARALGVPSDAARIAVGVSLGIPEGDEVAALVSEVERRVAEGYTRVKLKVRPGFDRAPVEAVRARFPETALTVDGNGGYTLAEALPLCRDLERHRLVFVEQPLAPDDVQGHARLAAETATPICLDETIESPADLETVLAARACGVVNLKPGRVGGVAASLAILERCRALSVPAWCGGMLETGIGRAHNVALAALPGFTLPGDLSASDRYWEREVITEPFRLGPGGTLAVPTGPGIGVEVDHDALEAVTVARDVISSCTSGARTT